MSVRKQLNSRCHAANCVQGLCRLLSSARVMDAKNRQPATDMIDLLPQQQQGDFSAQVKALDLSGQLTRHILDVYTAQKALSTPSPFPPLSREEESELATENLRLRQHFTEAVFACSSFRKTAISVIQNTWLFRRRQIFFNAGSTTTEEERQTALLMLSSTPVPEISLAHTFEHPVIARIWMRLTLSGAEESSPEAFTALRDIVTRLNTVRNIFVTMSLGLIHTFAERVPSIYRDGIATEDLVQIASFGVARAACRYSPATGSRFSTFCTRWVQKEIQRQALAGRLIRISSHIVDVSSRLEKGNRYQKLIHRTGSLPALDETAAVVNSRPALEEQLEEKQIHRKLLEILDNDLPERGADIIRRRYGLPPWDGKSQSVIEIATSYGVSRSSIYQQERTALKILRHHLLDLTTATQQE